VVEREHQRGTQPLAQRMARDLRLELADQVGAAAEREIGLDPVLERRQPLLLEPCDLRLGERLVGQLREGRPAPQRKGLPEALGGGRRVTGVERGATLGGQRLEAVGVELPGPDPEQVSARLGPQGRSSVAERPTWSTAFCSALAADGGGASPQSASMSRSAETTSLRRIRSSERSARCRPPDKGSGAVPSTTSSGPRIR
jgi:hypothetical protein